MKEEIIIRDIDNNSEKYADAFSEEGFINKIKRLSKRGNIKLVVLAFILYFTFVAETTPARIKAGICVYLGYLILPLDLIPDFVIGVGYVDDLVALMCVIKSVKDYITPAILYKTLSSASHLFKKEPVEQIRTIINNLNLYEPI